MKFSIIVPVFNVKQYLSRCLDSIVNQDFSDYELIIIDDGSTDGSGEICDKYCLQFSQIKVYHTQNGGLSRARNYGIKNSLGEYIIFLDSDDYISSGSLKKIASDIELNSSKYIDLYSYRAWRVDQYGNTYSKLNYKIQEKIYSIKEYLRKCQKETKSVSFCAPFYVYRRSLIKENDLKFKEDILYEDELWLPEVLLHCDKIMVSSYYFYYHFFRSGSITNSTDNYEKKINSTYLICMTLNNLYKKNNIKRNLYLRDRLAMLFMRGATEESKYKKTSKNLLFIDNKSLPIKNAFSLKEVLKSLLFYINPRIYLALYNIKVERNKSILKLNK